MQDGITPLRVADEAFLFFREHTVRCALGVVATGYASLCWCERRFGELEVLCVGTILYPRMKHGWREDGPIRKAGMKMPASGAFLSCVPAFLMKVGFRVQSVAPTA